MKRTGRSRAAALVVVFALVPSAATAAPLLQRPSGSEVVVRQAAHVAPYRCGVTSSKFARICRPSAQTSCQSAVARGVPGFSKTFCAARHTACVSCLAMLRRCISRIGHAARADFSCGECTGKFSRCIGKRYPVVAR
jgi:hypothetical protein